MENNIFIYSPDEQDIKFERFHICVWEFRNGTSIIEIGGEIKHDCLTNLDQLSIYLYIPWINNNHKVIDLYDNLKNPENSRFIFNDSVIDTKSLDGGIGIGGVIHSFVSRDRLCILPIQPDDIIDSTNKIVKLSLNSLKKSEGANVYFRFYIENDIKLLSTRKTGITHSTIIYDFKINEKGIYMVSQISLTKRHYVILPHAFS
ncbi:MAG: hypothetical protein PF638_06035 [Candidatus Delongbacteria bacterium]|jgi:hypothetical protein|nr:hypothetical protein [Candidatus Delongbacteria bacterium]